MNETTGRALSWDDEIETDGGGFELLPAGDYDFTVKSVTRGHHNGSAKIPACPMAKVELFVSDGVRSASIIHRFYLHSDRSGFLGAFFTAVGLKKPNEKYKMDWGAVPGRKGRCEIEINKYTGTDGKEHSNNQVKKFYPPDESKPSQPTTQTSWGNTSW